MKRSLLLGLLVAAAPALARAQDPLKVVATIPDLAALARSIGGDGVEVTTLVKPGQNPHKVLAKASMTLTLHRADVLIEMGLSYEHAFLPAALLKCRNKRIAPGGPGFMNVSAGIKPVEVPATLDRGQGPDLHPRAIRTSTSTRTTGASSPA